MVAEKISQIAVYIDVDNLAFTAQQEEIEIDFDVLFVALSRYGRVVFSKAYADWSKANRYSHMWSLHVLGVQTEQLGLTAGQKNTADMMMTVDALEHCLSVRRPDVLVVVSGDRDFVPLIQRVRMHGIQVVGAAFPKATSKVLRTICDHYLDLMEVFTESAEVEVDTALPPVHQPEQSVLPIENVEVREPTMPAYAPATKEEVVARLFGKGSLPTLDAVLATLTEIVEDLGRYGPVRGQRVKHEMETRIPGYNRANYGFDKESDLWKLAANRGLIRFETSPHDTLSPKSGPSVEAFIPDVSFENPIEAAREYWRIQRDERRLRMLDYEDRKFVVSELWAWFDNEEELQRHPRMSDIEDQLRTAGDQAGLDCTRVDYSKLALSLKFANAIRPIPERNVLERLDPRFEKQMNLGQALLSLDVVYILGILRDRVEDESFRLTEEGVAKWLYGATDEESVRRAATAIARARRERF